MNSLIPLMVRQAHHERNNGLPFDPSLPFVLSLSKDLYSISLAILLILYTACLRCFPAAKFVLH